MNEKKCDVIFDTGAGESYMNATAIKQLGGCYKIETEARDAFLANGEMQKISKSTKFCVNMPSWHGLRNSIY
jgi:hypothetical protein